MQIYYQRLKHDPNHVAWIRCEKDDIDKVKEIFPVENYEILVGLKYTYDPLTCDTHTLYNPPPPIWGVDIRKRTHGRYTTISTGENS
jgi:hypothetical protein